MRIEKLAGDKVKVTLTTAELISLDIDINTLSPNSKELHTFLFRIMETIREETGFNPYNGQVVVEASPSHDGISILVSKLKPLTKGLIRDELKNAVSVKARSKRAGTLSIFYFDVFDDLCAALKELTQNELSRGSLYRLNDTFCYVTENNPALLRCVSVLSEFSSKRSRYPMQITYIQEHGKLVAEGDALVSMAENIKSLT